MSEVFSFDELLNANGTKFDTVECHGKTLRLGSLSSADMIEWIRINNGDEAQSKFAGLELLVRSIVDAEGNRIPEARRPEFVTAFMQKDSSDNRKAIKKARELNGLDDVVKLVQSLGNASGETKTDASPSVSPQPQAE